MASQLQQPNNHSPNIGRQSALASLALTCLLALGGCDASSNNVQLHLGSVSVGEQLMDLQKAQAAGAISSGEFDVAKADLLRLLGNATSAVAEGNDNDGSEQ